ncbi:hypothetical protein HW130_13575 [Streptomyces sp. PKU-EA00015]|uniref:hypothetical protein n=1 Tax=Streptomyces sp. PKU-EA00015 TaxID=2748326 RepID=UPI0015A4CC2B|nr:hypothetical protein [Streptomyces sp. PKU-EA00015]NWF27292.1 hypothetical protein [Streptomyces sp. PKU-EA00015]
MTAMTNPSEHSSVPGEGPALGGQGVSPDQQESGRSQRSITLTVPSLDRVANGALNAALLPVAVARQVLPAKRGLPLYVGLGVLGAADVIEWPVAIGIGLGYAVLRRGGGVLAGPPGAPEHTSPRFGTEAAA